MTTRKTIMVVEDHKNVRSIFQEFIALLEYKAIMVESAEDALEILDEMAGKVDLVIADLIMPGMRGDEMVRTIKIKYPDVKILCMSGQVDAPSTDLEFPFLQKPFTISTLRNKIFELLGEY